MLEFLVSTLAPHICVVCRKEGAPICYDCIVAHCSYDTAYCYCCSNSNATHGICANCRTKNPLDRVFSGVTYGNVALKLVRGLKFERNKAMASCLASWILANFSLPTGVVVTHVPTANSRVRLRGYDQAKLIAQCLAKQAGLPYKELLSRRSKTRQVGSNRADRFLQLNNAFGILQPRYVAHRQILIVDDVVTTGATLEQAAITLKLAGAHKVTAATFAHQPK